MTIAQIEEELQHGDKAEIARLVGCGLSTVTAHFKQDRNADSKTGKKITEAAKKLIEFRKSTTKDLLKSESINIQA